MCCLWGKIEIMKTKAIIVECQLSEKVVQVKPFSNGYKTYLNRVKITFTSITNQWTTARFPYSPLTRCYRIHSTLWPIHNGWHARSRRVTFQNTGYHSVFFWEGVASVHGVMLGITIPRVKRDSRHPILSGLILLPFCIYSLKCYFS